MAVKDIRVFFVEVIKLIKCIDENKNNKSTINTERRETLKKEDRFRLKALSTRAYISFLI